MRERIFAGVIGFFIVLVLLMCVTKETLFSEAVIFFIFLAFFLLKHCFYGNPEKILSEQKIRKRNVQYVGSGGLKRAQEDFFKLHPNNVREYSNGIKVGDLLDGVTIYLRPGNATKFSSVEIHDTDGTKVKFRFK